MELRKIGDLVVEIVKKDIKNSHLSVYPPNGRIRLAVPEGTSDQAISSFIQSKYVWVLAQKKAFHEVERIPIREMLQMESHYVWGTRVLLDFKIGEESWIIQGNKLVRFSNKFEDCITLSSSLDSWYKQNLIDHVTKIIGKWESKLDVRCEGIDVKFMKTRWGSCNSAKRRISLNVELAKKDIDCAEYVLVHELIHILEPRHGLAFRNLMDSTYPNWKNVRERLNSAPLSHSNWSL
jgi:predicted metal-dependent hydrolase